MSLRDVIKAGVDGGPFFKAPPTHTEFNSLSRHAVNLGGDGAHKTVIVNGCAYSCCGRGWQRRDYEATYTGYIDNFEEREGDKAGTFMLYSVGIGTISYVIACRDYELQEVLA